MPSRPPSWCWSARPTRSDEATCWATGSTGSPIASRYGPGRTPPDVARRSGRERRRPRKASSEGDWSDLRPVLDEEIARLPEKYRAPVVLCLLEGQTHEEAARQLRWPLGTVKSRLARARARLQGRLTRRGLAPSAGLRARGPRRNHRRRSGPCWSDRRSRPRCGSRRVVPLAGVVPASVASLTEGVLRIMAMTKLKTIAITLMGAGVVTAGATGLAFQAPGGRAEAEQAEGGPQPKGRELDAAPKSTLRAR